MIHRPAEDNPFEFIRLASLRAQQLMRGCIPRVPASAKAVITAQQEVASRKVMAMPPAEKIDVAE